MDLKVGDYAIVKSLTYPSPLTNGDVVRIEHLGFELAVVSNSDGATFVMSKSKLESLDAGIKSSTPPPPLTGVASRPPDPFQGLQEDIEFYFKKLAMSERMGICWKDKDHPLGYGPFETMYLAIAHYKTVRQVEDDKKVVRVNFRSKRKEQL